MLLNRRLAAEAVGSLFLLTAVVGSGVMAERLSGGSIALALLANTVATGAALVALILVFAPISGAHLNPAVTLVEAWQGRLPWRDAPGYVAAQLMGAYGGVATAHAMFELPAFVASRHVRTGPAQWLAELVATFGLIMVIRGCAHSRPSAVPWAVGSYITAAYWFTSSTSFANPAVTLARAATDSFSGIRPLDAPGFVVAQLMGAAAAALFMEWLIVLVPKADESVQSIEEEVV
jgi:glycerol uptake facilitator-like aquaporin